MTANTTTATESKNFSGALRPKSNYTSALVLLTSLFFMWGFITCLNDILIPHLKGLFDLNYTKTMLIQFTFFGAYALMSIPAVGLLAKLDIKKVLYLACPLLVLVH